MNKRQLPESKIETLVFLLVSRLFNVGAVPHPRVYMVLLMYRTTNCCPNLIGRLDIWNQISHRDYLGWGTGSPNPLSFIYTGGKYWSVDRYNLTFATETWVCYTDQTFPAVLVQGCTHCSSHLGPLLHTATEKAVPPNLELPRPLLNTVQSSSPLYRKTAPNHDACPSCFTVGTVFLRLYSIGLLFWSHLTTRPSPVPPTDHPDGLWQTSDGPGRVVLHGAPVWGRLRLLPFSNHDADSCSHQAACLWSCSPSTPPCRSMIWSLASPRQLSGLAHSGALGVSYRWRLYREKA